MTIDVLLGMQWGDEGKGKIVDVLAPNYDVVARFQGGPNAGHTLIINGHKSVLHTIPSGIFHDNLINLIGNGVVIDPVTLKAEVDELEAHGVDVRSKLKIARKAHLILPTHRALDAASEASKGKEKIGSTLRGIGPTYMDKTGRNGLRVGDITQPDFLDRYNNLKSKHEHLLQNFDYKSDVAEAEKTWLAAIDFLRSLTLVDAEYYINDLLKQGKKVLAEGAQGAMLDIDFGTYPYVTSSNTITAGVLTGLGVAPQKIDKVIGIAKAYVTRVGSGPFPTELHDEVGEKIRQEGFEFGATTGRPRRCGWLDLPALKYASMLTGLTELVLTKVDILNNFEAFQVCHAYKIDGQVTGELPFDVDNTEIGMELTDFEGWNKDIAAATSIEQFPAQLMTYLEFIERELNIPITIVSTGPGREELVRMDSKLVGDVA